MQQLYKTSSHQARHHGIFVQEIVMHSSIDLAGKLATFTEAWQPRTVSLFNGHDVMVAKLRGEYHWHVHPDTDDFFLVLSGQLEIDLEDGSMVTLNPGQLYVVPKGVSHRPRAKEEAHILLIEPTGTPNSGDPLTAAPRQLI
jgi:mannose-6-phosphate isomerase-like protein (cupin superfamily)